ncbi:MAG: DUF393 domain-containing protein [Actinobacteria bacterium]|nr:DUF393 domain-containing protein [Actinomycetota bacterium]
MTTSATRPAPPVLVYDGDCGFCTRSAGVARRFVMPAGGTVAASYDLDLDAFGLTMAECMEALQFVDSRGRVHAAQDAVAHLLLAGAPWWKPLGAVLLVPGLNTVAGVLYRAVARNRYRLPGGTAACAMPSPSQQPSQQEPHEPERAA